MVLRLRQARLVALAAMSVLFTTTLKSRTVIADDDGARLVALAAMSVLFTTVLQSRTVIADDDGDTTYGVDCSFPMHSTELRCGDLLGARAEVYQTFMQGCREKYGDKCDKSEAARIEKVLQQPQSMVNFTSTGYKVIRTPQKMKTLLSDFLNTNTRRNEQFHWPPGMTFANHWSSPTYILDVENEHHGGGEELANSLVEIAKEAIEGWTGMEERLTLLHGIRIYSDGAILSPHVDRTPLVHSVIVNIAQSVDEEWPLEIIDRNGDAVNITMRPFDMFLYESHSLIHGRPFALKGRYFANIFFHFEPTGKLLSSDPTVASEEVPVDDTFPNFPPYILSNSPYADVWKSRNSDAGQKASS